MPRKHPRPLEPLPETDARAGAAVTYRPTLDTGDGVPAVVVLAARRTVKLRLSCPITGRRRVVRARYAELFRPDERHNQGSLFVP